MSCKMVVCYYEFAYVANMPLCWTVFFLHAAIEVGSYHINNNVHFIGISLVFVAYKELGVIGLLKREAVLNCVF